MGGRSCITLALVRGSGQPGQLVGEGAAASWQVKWLLLGRGWVLALPWVYLAAVIAWRCGNSKLVLVLETSS